MKKALMTLIAVFCLVFTACSAKNSPENFQDTAEGLGYKVQKVTNEYTNDAGTFASATKGGVVAVFAEMEKTDGAKSLFEFQKNVMGYSTFLTGGSTPEVLKTGGAEYVVLDASLGYMLVLRDGKTVLIVTGVMDNNDACKELVKSLGYSIKYE